MEPDSVIVLLGAHHAATAFADNQDEYEVKIVEGNRDRIIWAIVRSM